MALKGNLRDFTITQLLNLINLAKKSGTLVIEGSQETARVFFREGKLAFAELGTEDSSLANLLYKSNKFSQAQYHTLRTRAGTLGDKELGLLLINAGYLTRQDVLTVLQGHFIAILHKLFTWVEGFFSFESDVQPPPDKIITRIDLENIIIEGSRRLREWEQLQEEIPNLEMALRFADRPGAHLKNVNLSVQEWKVVGYINPKNTMRQIAKVAQLNDLEIRRIVYGLLQAGLIEIVRPLGATLPYQTSGPLVEGDKEKQRSLINRLIGRIRSL